MDAGCPQNSLRLQGGANSMTGRVEICNANVWGTVCDDFWGAPDARVACRQLGFSPTGLLCQILQRHYYSACSTC
jgi:deleted-in-malignant-brain-tumors protein 1